MAARTSDDTTVRVRMGGLAGWTAAHDAENTRGGAGALADSPATNACGSPRVLPVFTLTRLPRPFVSVTPTPDPDCASCPVDAGRRDFVRAATLAVAAALAGLGLAARVAEALPVMGVSGIRLRATVKYPIPAADSVQIDKANEVILVRWEGHVFAFSLSCPHQNTALRWSEPDKRFICPKHKSNYTPTGGFIEGRATRGMDRLGITRAGAEVVVDVEQLFREDENAAEWKAAVVAV